MPFASNTPTPGALRSLEILHFRESAEAVSHRGNTTDVPGDGQSMGSSWCLGTRSRVSGDSRCIITTQVLPEKEDWEPVPRATTELSKQTNTGKDFLSANTHSLGQYLHFAEHIRHSEAHRTTRPLYIYTGIYLY